MTRQMPATATKSRKWRGGPIPEFDDAGQVVETPAPAPAPATAEVARRPASAAPVAQPVAPPMSITFKRGGGVEVVGEPTGDEVALAGLHLLSEVAQRIGTRDQGPPGRNGESVIEFRNGYRELVEVVADSHKPPYPPHARFIGHSIVGTAETDPGWWIELWIGGMFGGLTIKVADGVQGGQLTWTDRATYAYQRSELKTLRQRERIKRWMREDFDGFWAMCLDTGRPGWEKLPSAEWIFRLLEQRPDLADLAVDGQQVDFEEATKVIFAKTILGMPDGLAGLEEQASELRDRYHIERSNP